MHEVKGRAFNAMLYKNDQENTNAHRCCIVGTLCSLASTATSPYTAIVIDSGSPYFDPKSATISSGVPVRWDNLTIRSHIWVDMEDGNTCAFDSGIFRSNGNFTLQGLPSGHYPYFCRLHPIMHGVVIVEDTFVPSQL